jgi:hypothetical protein
MPRGLLSSPNDGIRRQETELRTQISFHLRHSSIGVSAFHDSCAISSNSVSRTPLLLTRTTSSVRESEMGPSMAGIPQPAEEGLEPDTSGAWKLAPKILNG